MQRDIGKEFVEFCILTAMEIWIIRQNDFVQRMKFNETVISHFFFLAFIYCRIFRSPCLILILCNRIDHMYSLHNVKYDYMHTRTDNLYLVKKKILKY